MWETLLCMAEADRVQELWDRVQTSFANDEGKDFHKSLKKWRRIDLDFWKTDKKL